MVSNYRARYFDESGGVFRALKNDIKYNYMLWNIDGSTCIMNTFKDVNDSIKGYFMELTGCQEQLSGEDRSCEWEAVILLRESDH